MPSSIPTPALRMPSFTPLEDPFFQPWALLSRIGDCKQSFSFQPFPPLSFSPEIHPWSTRKPLCTPPFFFRLFSFPRRIRFGATSWTFFPCRRLFLVSDPSKICVIAISHPDFCKDEPVDPCSSVNFFFPSSPFLLYLFFHPFPNLFLVSIALSLTQVFPCHCPYLVHPAMNPLNES